MKTNLLANSNSSKKWLTKCLGLLLSICLLVGVLPMGIIASADTTVDVWDGSVATAFGGGNGNWDNPYIINNGSQLAYMASVLSSGTGTAYSGKNFLLTADIYLNDITNYDSWSETAPANIWNSIGHFKSTSDYRDFGGTFDGDGHTIYGLYTAGTVDKGTGLFGAINKATIKDLTIDKAYVTGTTVVGGIAGVVRGNTTIENSRFSGVVKASGNFAGGIAGKYVGSNGTAFNMNTCYVKGEVAASGVIVGGFVGDFVKDTVNTIAININNSYCAANVSSSDKRAGGFIGRASDVGSETKKSVTIRKSHFYGTLSNLAIGTLVGQDASSITTAIDTYYNGDIIGGTTKTLVLGVSKTSTEFKDGTVTTLLNNVEDATSDKLGWKQGNEYPCFENEPVIDDGNDEPELDVEVWDGTAATSLSGNGNWDNPYIISNGSDLAYIASVLSSGSGTAFNGKNFLLTADIYLNDITNYDSWSETAPANIWNSIGHFKSTSDYRDFGGTFDGDGHTIYGLYTAGTVDKGTGLFGAINKATIKDLTIDKAYVTGTTVVGGIVGVARGNSTIENCGFSGVVKVSGNFAGGIAGKYEGSEGTVFSVNSCYVEGEVSTTGVIVGGFIGDFTSNTVNTIAININNSYCVASISGSDYRTAGFIGRVSNYSNETKKSVMIRKSHFYGTLSSNATGTIVGMDGAKVTIATDTYYNGDIIGGSNKTLVYGISKTTNEFKDGTVLRLLKLAIIEETDIFDWVQGEFYPQAPKNIKVLGSVASNITVDKKSGNIGDVIKVTVKPAEGKVLKAGSLCYLLDGIKHPIYARYDSWVYTGNPKPDEIANAYNDNGIYYFNLPSGNVIIQAEFIDKDSKNISTLGAFASEEGLMFASRVYNTYKVGDKLYNLSNNFGTIIIRADKCEGLDLCDVTALENWLNNPSNFSSYKKVVRTKLADKTENYFDYNINITGIDETNEMSVKYIAIAYAKYGDSNGTPITLYSEPYSESYNTAVAKGLVNYVIAPTVMKLKGEVTTTKGYKWIEAGNKANEILKTEDVLDLSNSTVYYVSPNGDDNNNGTSKDTPWKSAEKVAEFLNDRIAAEQTSNIAILFERGGLYRQNGIFNINSNVIIGAYGVGSKPQIYGSRQNYAVTSLWQQTEGNSNIWFMNTELDDIGIIVFGDNASIGVKKNYFDDMKNNGDFYHDRLTGKLYLYFAYGNPAEKYKSIEIGSRGNLFFIGEYAKNVTIDNLTIKYGGSHAIGTRANVKNIIITNCEIAWIGGSYQADDNFTRYGNGVQFWDSSENCRVENNWIYQIYDTGITFQGAINANDARNSYKDIYFTNNLIEYCTYSVEFFDRVATSTAVNIYINNNIMRFAGYGWGKQRTDASGTSHICGWTKSGAFIKYNFNIKNNIFEYTTGNFVYWNWENDLSYSGVSISNNSFYKPATVLGYVMSYGYDEEISGTKQITAHNQQELEAAVAVFDPNPSEVVWVKN